MENKKLTFGFWRTDKNNYSENLPFPEENIVKWNGQDDFVQKLKEKQSRIRATKYKGFSKCRICGCDNGSGEYEDKRAIWTSGAIHYIEAHNVKPNQEFIDYIIGLK